MVPHRRRFLSLCAGVFTVSTAGCLGDDSLSADDSPSRPDPDEAIDSAGLTTYTTRLEAELDRQRSVFEFEEIDGQGPRGPRLPYVISGEQADALLIDPEPPDVDDVRAFLEETDYDEATVLVHQARVDACHERVVTHVRRRGGGGFSTQFCTTTRDPSVECSTDETHHQITLVRVPESSDQTPSGSGRGNSSSCRLPPDHPEFEGGDG